MAPPMEGMAHLGWVLELDDCMAIVRATETTNPFIWIRGGIAHALPRSEALATEIATANRDLVVGRLFLACGDDIAMAVFDETIFGGYLSMRYEPSVEDAISRFETGLQYTAQWSATIREKFGGRRFEGDDWHLMGF